MEFFSIVMFRYIVKPLLSQKISQKKSLDKISSKKLCTNNGWDHVSISSKFYEPIFCTKVLHTAFLKLHFGFVLKQNIGTKGSCKMLMKLTTRANFTNILQSSITRPDSKGTETQPSQCFCAFGICASKTCS